MSAVSREPGVAGAEEIGKSIRAVGIAVADTGNDFTLVYICEGYIDRSTKFITHYSDSMLASRTPPSISSFVRGFDGKTTLLATNPTLTCIFSNHFSHSTYHVNTTIPRFWFRRSSCAGGVVQEGGGGGVIYLAQ